MEEIQSSMTTWFSDTAKTLIIVMVIVAVIAFLYKKLETKLLDFLTGKIRGGSSSIPKKTGNTNNDYLNAYCSKWLFSINERDAFIKIKHVTDSLNLVLLAKVRLLDLIEPKDGIKNYKGALWKIQSKHVDFVICTEKLVPKIIIELDDSSHGILERQERDAFVDAVLSKAGYRVMHLWAINELRLEQQIKDILKIEQ